MQTNNPDNPTNKQVRESSKGIDKQIPKNRQANMSINKQTDKNKQENRQTSEKSNGNFSEKMHDLLTFSLLVKPYQ